MIDLDFKSKTGGIGVAFATFSRDVQSDPDFIRYKQQAKDYGLVMPRSPYTEPIKNEQLIIEFYKNNKI